MARAGWLQRSGGRYSMLVRRPFGSAGSRFFIGALSLLLAPLAFATSDLIPQNISVPATVTAGASFTASWTLANTGSTAADHSSTTVVRINQSTSSAAGTNLASI